MAEPRRILIDWDYGASGLWWCSTKEENEAPYERWSYLTSVQQPDGPPIRMPEKVTRLQEQGRQLAVRVQEELGTNGWEVLYKLDGRVRRVQPPGSWPVMTWHEELLGYSSRRRRLAEEEAPHKSAQHGGDD